MKLPHSLQASPSKPFNFAISLWSIFISCVCILSSKLSLVFKSDTCSETIPLWEMLSWWFIVCDSSVNFFGNLFLRYPVDVNFLISSMLSSDPVDLVLSSLELKFSLVVDPLKSSKTSPIGFTCAKSVLSR